MFFKITWINIVLNTSFQILKNKIFYSGIRREFYSGSIGLFMTFFLQAKAVVMYTLQVAFFFFSMKTRFVQNGFLLTFFVPIFGLTCCLQIISLQTVTLASLKRTKSCIIIKVGYLVMGSLSISCLALSLSISRSLFFIGT